MLKNLKGKLLAVCSAVMCACGGAAVANAINVANNGDINVDNGVISMDGLYDGMEFGWVSSGVVSGKAEDVVEGQPSVEIVSNNLSFSSDLYLLFATYKENTDATVKMLYWTEAQETYTIDTAIIADKGPFSERNNEGTVWELFKYQILPKEMANVIYARAYIEIPNEDGSVEIVYSEPVRYSVVDYVYDKKEDGLKTTHEELLDAMLSYGAASQVHFGLKAEGSVGSAENRDAFIQKTPRVVTDTYYNVTVENGTFADGFTYGRYTAKEVVEIVADTAEGVEFDYWKDKNGTIVSYDGMAGIKVSANTSLKAISGEWVYESNGEDEYGNVKSYTVGSYMGTDKNVTIPVKHNGVSVVYIKEETFANKYFIQTVTIPEGITSIGEKAFYACDSIYRVNIPKTVKRIQGELAFYGCKSMQEFVVAENNNGGYKAINGSLYGENGKQLLQYALGRTEERVYILDTVEKIAPRAFRNARFVKEVYIPITVTAIGVDAFRNCPENMKIYYEGATDGWVAPEKWNPTWNSGNYEVLFWNK